jgi:acyl-CoA thioesterase
MGEADRPYQAAPAHEIITPYSTRTTATKAQPMTQQAPFSAALSGMHGHDPSYQAHIDPCWSQGRAGFGGIVNALCLEAIRRTLCEHNDERPLRSFALAFVGPALGPVELAVERLRAGRTVTFMRATMRCDGQVVASLDACYGHDRPSALRLSPPPVAWDGAQVMAASPETCPALDFGGHAYPGFLDCFEVRLAGTVPLIGGKVGEVMWWVRHRDPVGHEHPLGLPAVMDALPPAALPLFDHFIPLSSLTWSADFVEAYPRTRDGWWLLRSLADYATGGFSGQTMHIWNRDGALVAMQRQSVALFG